MQISSYIHPGSVIRKYLDELELSVTDAASVLGVSRVALSRLLNERAILSMEMAIRLAKAFGGTSDYWLQLQFNYDLKNVRELEEQIQVKPYAPAKDLMVQVPLNLFATA